MVRKAPELATATTPPGLRNDPHAPHNRGNGRARSTARRGSREDVVAVTATNAGGGSVGGLQRLNIPGLPPGVEVMGGVSSMMIPPNARMLGSMTFSGNDPEAFDPQRIGSMILSHMMGADRPGGSVQQRDSRNTPRDISRDESRRERSERGAGGRGRQNTNSTSNPSSNNTSSRERPSGTRPPRLPTADDVLGADEPVHTQVFDTPDGPVTVEIEMGPMMADGVPMLYPSRSMRGREGTTPVRGAGNGGSQPPATGQNTNNNNNSRRNRRTNPAQALATYAIRLDRHLTAPQQQQQQQQQQQGQQNQQEDEHLESVVHHGVCCDSCEVMPIRGARYKCTNRDDYDLCSECYRHSSGRSEGSDLRFHRLVYPLPIGLMDGREISLFGDDLESDSEDHVPETAPIFTNERTANATAGGTSNNTNDNVTTSGISTAQGDVDALTTALDVASRSAQRLIPQLTQLSERVRSGDIFQSTPNASSSQERRDNNEQSVVNGEILEIASQMHAIGALWTELARGVSSVAPAALPASAFPSSESMNARPRNRTIPFMNSLRTALGGESAGNEQRNDEVGNGVYTQNVSASRSFRLPRTVYLDRSSAFATVIPAMVGPATLAQMQGLAQMADAAYNRTPESAQPSPLNERNDVGSFDGIRMLGWAPPPQNLPEGERRAPASLISANTERIRAELRERGASDNGPGWMMGGEVIGAPIRSPSSRAAATPRRSAPPRRATHNNRAPATTTNQNAANNATTTNNRRRGGGTNSGQQGTGGSDVPAPKRTRRGG